jgi:hypothetical protein
MHVMTFRLPKYFLSRGVILVALFGLTQWSATVRACGSEELGTDQQLVVALEAGASVLKESYYLDLIKLLLSRTEERFGPCELVLRGDVLTRQRNLALISSRYDVDLFWGTTSNQREVLLRPIRIPLHKGLMSRKILLIRPEDQPLFSEIHTLEQLRRYRAGAGEDWPDTEIFRANGLTVVGTTNYAALGRMLAGGRFDFFPRGSSEVGPELRNLAGLPLAVEQELVLIYPAPVYFFVNRRNTRLFTRLETGLREMMDDGSFDRYFHNHPVIREALTSLNLEQRRPIYLTNPYLPDKTPLDDERYWLYPWTELVRPVVEADQ